MLSAVRAACAATNLLELHRLATTIETWWPEILAFLHTGITNAGSEGTNRVIKPSPATPTNPQPEESTPPHPRPHRGHLNPAQLRRARIWPPPKPVPLLTRATAPARRRQPLRFGSWGSGRPRKRDSQGCPDRDRLAGHR